MKSGTLTPAGQNCPKHQDIELEHMDSKYTAAVFSLALTAVISVVSVYTWRRKWLDEHSRAGELRKSLASTSEKCAAERQGRIRAQQALRKALAKPRSENSRRTSYPLVPIGLIRSCFSTRNGTPRQPLLVPLARACLVFDSAIVPPASLEGIEEYSHCWIIYVFHLNTDLEKLWKDPANSKFKAKVRVPRLKGERKGVFATRSPHRPCPIGLTVAKVEAIKGHMLLLSGVDLVDGTPVLDIKPYLPYCDSISEAMVPKWVQMENMLLIPSVSFSNDFSSSLTGCWKAIGKSTLYASAEELKTLVKQLLSWDIRSVSQRNQPHDGVMKIAKMNAPNNVLYSDNSNDDEASERDIPSGDIVYHLILEGIDFSYRIDCDRNVMVENARLSSGIATGDRSCNFLTWEDRLE